VLIARRRKPVDFFVVEDETGEIVNDSFSAPYPANLEVNEYIAIRKDRAAAFLISK
jgi:hypothetical protein